MAIRDRILERMRQLDINNGAELAKRSGVTQGAISRYLNGRIPKIPELLKLCRALQCDTNYLLEMESKENPDLLTIKRIVDRAVRKASSDGGNLSEEDKQALQIIRDTPGMSQILQDKTALEFINALIAFEDCRMTPTDYIQRAEEILAKKKQTFFGARFLKFIAGMRNHLVREELNRYLTPVSISVEHMERRAASMDEEHRKLVQSAKTGLARLHEMLEGKSPLR